MVAYVLGGDISQRGCPEYADIFNTKLHIRVEVKTRDNKHSFGVGLSQLEHYESFGNLPPGITDTLYALVTYRNGKRGAKETEPNSHSRLALVRGRPGRHRLVANTLDEVYLFDIAIVEALRSIFPIKHGQYPGENRREQDTIKIGRRELRRLFRDSTLASILKQLGLSPSNWTREKISLESEMMIEGRVYESRFTFISLLRRNTHSRLMPVVRTKTPTLT